MQLPIDGSEARQNLNIQKSPNAACDEFCIDGRLCSFCSAVLQQQVGTLTNELQQRRRHNVACREGKRERERERETEGGVTSMSAQPPHVVRNLANLV